MHAVQTITITREGATVDANVRDYVIAAIVRGEMDRSILDGEEPTPDVIATRVAVAVALGDLGAEQSAMYFANVFPQSNLLALLRGLILRDRVMYFSEMLASDDLRDDILRRLGR